MITFILFIIILGLIVLVHEFGHFIWAKKAGVHVYEFSIGFGPKLFSFNRKNDETTYLIKAIPLGGYVALAGELSGEGEDDKEVKEENKLYNKPWLSRLMVMVAGVLNNFILGFVLLFILGLIYGSTLATNEIANIDKTHPLYKSGARNGDLIVKINKAKIKDYDDIQTELALNGEKKPITLTYKSKGKEKTVKLKPIYDKKDKRYYYGISVKTINKKGIFSSLKFAFVKFCDIYKQLIIVIKSLFTHRIGVESVSGPVGIFQVIDIAKSSLFMLIYLTAYLSINVGFMNILPFPAFDGGHVLFLIIEKIKGSRVDAKLENTVNLIGFSILIILMILITIKDVFNLL